MRKDRRRSGGALLPESHKEKIQPDVQYGGYPQEYQRGHGIAHCSQISAEKVVLLGLCMGSGVVFSLCFGKQDEERLKKAFSATGPL